MGNMEQANQVLDQILAFLPKVGAGITLGIGLYRLIRGARPKDLPDLTDTQIIQLLRDRAKANLEKIDAEFAALEQGPEPA